MARKATNIGASVRARLWNLARARQANFQRMLTRYALERLLFRLSVSPHRESFILKGAMLYAAWLDDPFRSTRDLDLLSLHEGEAGRFVAIFADICVQPVEEDGLIFDAEHIAAEPIRREGPYGGLRLRTSARLASAVIPVRIDIGFGDAVTPGPLELEYPVLLGQAAPTLNAYPRTAVAAEKFETIVALDLANSRMKDFYDLLAMSRLFTFEGATLAAAIHATFDRRRTNIPCEHQSRRLETRLMSRGRTQSRAATTRNVTHRRSVMTHRSTTCWQRRIWSTLSRQRSRVGNDANGDGAQLRKDVGIYGY